MNAIETVVGYSTNQGTAISPLSGDVFKARNCEMSVFMDVWALLQSDGYIQLWNRNFYSVSPLEFQTINNQISYLNMFPMFQNLERLEDFTLSQSASLYATVYDYVAMNFLHRGIIDIRQSLLTYADFLRRAQRYVSFTKNIVISSNTRYYNSRYNGAVTFLGLNGLNRNKHYALIGFQENGLGNSISCIALRGPDTGGLNVGLPPVYGLNERANFLYNARLFPGQAYIPMFLGENLEGTEILVSGNEHAAGGTAKVCFHFVELL
jgi:hypothetical protein